MIELELDGGSYLINGGLNFRFDDRHLFRSHTKIN